MIISFSTIRTGPAYGEGCIPALRGTGIADRSFGKFRPGQSVWLPFGPYFLIGVSVGKSSKKREHDNQKVQGQGPVPDIIKIVFDTLLN